ncbi:lysophospholipid acyltransferase family protein [Sphingomonas jaspsi]|uniref:lysophospholipid acyltransferase family protein n=1 Tax=Sphingomonas jaspsi TaxID=392409 RepID=UPI0004B8104A|nr:lysophospholipid acyltransferase family protein [Sphingomonas jaspsi]
MTQPADLPRLNPLARLVYWLIIQWYDRTSWTAVGTLPPERKFVIVGASHTSNWDFLVFLGTIRALGRRVRFIGKHSLFRWPMEGFMRGLGGVPVNRTTSKDLVRQVVDQFDRHDDFALIVAAEGTRSYTEKWRSGFYQIALQAGVPIVCAGPDYPTKRGIIGPVIRPTGDYARDMKPAFDFFRSLRPKHPERAGFPPDS